MTTRYVLIEEDGFELVAQPGEYWVSWISHKTQDCSGEAVLRDSDPWRWVNVFEGHCTYCPARVPEGLLGAWKLHNYENYTTALRVRDTIRGYR